MISAVHRQTCHGPGCTKPCWPGHGYAVDEGDQRIRFCTQACVEGWQTENSRGTLTVRSQADAIALEQSVRRHVFAWWEQLDVFDRPSLLTPRLRKLEQAARDAEYEQRWDDCERAWSVWLDAIREAAP